MRRNIDEGRKPAPAGAQLIENQRRICQHKSSYTLQQVGIYNSVFVKNIDVQNIINILMYFGLKTLTGMQTTSFGSF